MATVKGDVHDIGKNIVSVVLACNNYDIIDLGVMVPAHTIIKQAVDNNVDIIGLSGLITPSLDEMVTVAEEMQEKGLSIPLLIGGATTSRLHTALRINEVYDGPVIHVNDASKSVPISSKLLSKDASEYSHDVDTEYKNLKQSYLERKQDKNLLSISEANKRRYKIDWKNYTPVQPQTRDQIVLDEYDLAQISAYIDWTPFFQSWDMHGKYPALLDDKVIGEQARELYADTEKMLSQIIAEKSLTAKAVLQIFPAHTEANTIVIADGERFPTLRQQTEKTANAPNLALADFIAPAESGLKDNLGMFAVSIFGAEEMAKAYTDNNDDYSAILVKSLADRLVEAFTELLHERVRKEYWGYSQSEELSNADLIREQYKGIRPAPGYPACPCHEEKNLIWRMLQVEQNTGATLTESLAMYPAASVSGFYFAHTESKYFGVGKIGLDQVESYAQSAKVDIETAKKRLNNSIIETQR